MLHLSPQKSGQTSAPKVATIGGRGKNNVKGTVVSDIEFRDLVLKTENSDVSRIDSTEAGLDHLRRRDDV